MSVTEQIARIKNARDKIRTKLAGCGLTFPSANITDCAAAIGDLDISTNEHTDNTTAYVKNVLSDNPVTAKISKIGGMTRKCANLIPFPYVDGDAGTVKEMNGATFTVNADGSITINGTPTGTAYFRLSNGIEWATTSISADSVEKNADGKTFFNCRYNASNTLLTVNLSTGTTYTNTVVHPTINSGSTALPYEPYFEGLRSARVTEVESVGVNLIPYPYKNTTQNSQGIIYTDNGDGTITIKGNITGEYLSQFILYDDDIGFVMQSDGAFIVRSITSEILGVFAHLVVNGSNLYGTRHTLKKGDVSTRMRLYMDRLKTLDETVAPILNYGPTPKPYTPYVKHTLPIPEAVRNLDGYGWGVNESVYNYVDFDKKQFVKRVGKKDMGTLNWKKGSLSDGHYRFLSTIPDIKKSVNAVAVGNILCDIADVISNSESYIGAYGIAVSHNSNQIFLSGAEYDGMSDTSLKAAMSGVMLCYELAEPVITDISDLITADNLIGVEGGGTLTFENEYGYAVPSEVTYVELNTSIRLSKIVFNTGNSVLELYDKNGDWITEIDWVVGMDTAILDERYVFDRFEVI